MEPPIAALPGEVLPAVPAVAPPALLVDPVEAAPEVDPAPLAALPLLPGVELEPVVVPEPMRALVSMKVPLPVARGVLVVAPAVPLVPVAPGVLPLPCRQPVTVTVRLAPAAWLPVVEPDCADMLTAQPSAIANVAPVHTLFIRYLPKDTRGLCAITTPYVTSRAGHTASPVIRLLCTAVDACRCVVVRY